MNIFLTGATGYIGNNLAHKLANLGHTVKVLTRSHSSQHLLQHPNIKIIIGDVLDADSVFLAMQGCTQVYHVAAAVAPWMKNTSEYYNINVGGTIHVLDAAKRLRVSKVVVTSSCGVIGPSLQLPMREEDPRIIGYKTDYELSKKMQEDVAMEYAKQGLNVVLVSPAKVYGPGHVSHSLTANEVIKTFLNKKIVVIPAPGTYKACFCFIDDVINGHMLAMEKGTSGERYILGGHNISYFDFFDTIRKLAGTRSRIVRAPPALFKFWALAQQVAYRIFGKPPSFAKQGLAVVFANYIFSSNKAVQQLGYTITPLHKALLLTISSLKTQQHDQETLHTNNRRQRRFWEIART